jgi:hypothetical protein
MDYGILVLAATPIIGAYIYWDYKRVQKMVVPPPPKPAPLPDAIPADEKETTYRKTIAYGNECEHEIKSRPIDQMTGSEWAQVKELIAAAQLDTASSIGSWIVVLIFCLVSYRWPDNWWIYIPILIFGKMVITRPFEKQLEKARDYARNSDFRW